MPRPAQQPLSVRRRDILDAAMRVFERDGLKRASMRGIAAEAGVTTGAIYPIFDGKEAIYAAMLEKSLDRLHAHVARAAAAAADGITALTAGARAFYDYYASRLFEFELGLYLFEGVDRRGLGAARDKRLNDVLMRTLDIFTACVQRAAPELGTDAARRERDALFAAIIGALVLEFTGRARSIGTTSEQVFGTVLDGLKARLAP